MPRDVPARPVDPTPANLLFLRESPPPPPAWREAARITWRLLAEIRKEAAGLGARSALVILPCQEDIRGFSAIVSGSPELRRQRWDFSRTRRQAVQAAGALGMPFLDIEPVFRRLGGEVYFPGDPHPTPAGHALIAQALAGFLAEEGLVPAGGTPGADGRERARP